MPTPFNNISTNFREGPAENLTDLGTKFVTKSYLIDTYPHLTGLGNPQFAGLWGWGDNANGKLGDGTVTYRSSPVQTICKGTGWKSIAAGYLYSAAIKTDGTLWLWGTNNYGQLGDNTAADKSSPVQTVAGGTNWKQVSCWNEFTAAIKTDGTLWSWGRNNYGQLGDRTVVSKSSPIQTIAGGTNWKQIGIGQFHLSAIKTDGTLWSCGRNNYGQLGDGSITSKSSPVQTVTGGTNWKQVSGGEQHTLAVKTDGTLWGWGDNYYHYLGTGTDTYGVPIKTSSPIQTAAGGNTWKKVSAGDLLGIAIKTDGSLWVWGQGYLQMAMVGSGLVNTPTRVGLSNNWKDVSGQIGVAAIQNDGSLWTAGTDPTLYDKIAFSATYQYGAHEVYYFGRIASNNTLWKSAAAGYNYTMAIAEMGDDF